MSSPAQDQSAATVEEAPTTVPAAVEFAITKRRYPGTRSFEDTIEDQRLFTGREAEIEELCRRIASHRVIVLYATSGTGKTSLLKAGVFPQLRQSGYLPLNVRFNPEQPEEKTAKTEKLFKTALLDQLAAEVAKECSRQELNVEIFDQPERPASFLEYFNEVEFWGDDYTLVPVLILDQFEEIFQRYTRPQRDALLHEISLLIAGGTAGSKTEASRLRIVISLREDSIGQLLELGREVPGLMDHSLRLLPLSAQAAKEAIIRPAAHEETGPDYTPPFACDDDAVRNLVEWLAEKSHAEIRDFSAAASGAVESFVLQIFCEHIEDHIIARRAAGEADARFSLALFSQPKEKERVLRGYYHHKLIQFLTSGTRDAAAVPEPGAYWGASHLLFAKSFLRALVRNPRRGLSVLLLLEGDLLTNDGRRRPGELEELLTRRQIGDNDLKWLVDKRLVRAERHGGLKLLNLSHDQLAAAIHHHSLLRTLKRVVIGYGALVGVILIVIGAAWAVESQRAEKLEAVAAKEEVENLRNSAFELAKSRALAADSSEAIAAWSVASKLKPGDLESFSSLVEAMQDAGIVIPKRLWTGGVPLTGKTAKDTRTIVDSDKRHFAVIREGKCVVRDSNAPDSAIDRFELPADMRDAAFALGCHGSLLVGLLPGKPSASRSNDPAAQVEPKSIAVRAPFDTRARLWRRKSGQPEEGSSPVDFAVSKDGTINLSPGGAWLALSTDGRAGIQLVTSEGNMVPPIPQVPASPETGMPAHSPEIYSIAFHPQDDLVAVVEQYGRCFVLLSDGTAWQPLPFTNRNDLAAMGPDQSARLPARRAVPLHLGVEPSGSSPSPIPRGGTTPNEPVETTSLFSDIEFSSDGEWLVGTDDSGEVRVWPVAGLKSGKDQGWNLHKQNNTIPPPSSTPEFGEWQSAGATPPAEVRFFPVQFGMAAQIGQERKPVIGVDCQLVSSQIPLKFDTELRWAQNFLETPINCLTGGYADQFSLNPNDAPDSLANDFVTRDGKTYLREILNSGMIAEVALKPLPSLLPELLKLEESGTRSWISSDGNCLLVWNEVTKKLRITDFEHNPLFQEIKLLEDERPLNVSNKESLVTILETEEGDEVKIRNLRMPGTAPLTIQLPEEVSGPYDEQSFGVCRNFLLGHLEPEINYQIKRWRTQDGSTAPAVLLEFYSQFDLDHGFAVTGTSDEVVGDPFKIVDLTSVNPVPVVLELPDEVRPYAHTVTPHFSRDGNRLTCLTYHPEGEGDIQITSFERHGSSWTLRSNRTFPNIDVSTGGNSRLAISDDGLYAVLFGSSDLYAWRLGEPDVAPDSPAQELPRLSWVVSPTDGYDVTGLRFLPNSTQLAVSLGGVVAIVDVAAWDFSVTTPEQRSSVVQLISKMSPPAVLAKLAEGSADFIDPAEKLWNAFEANGKSPGYTHHRNLVRLVSWMLARDEPPLPNPFATQTMAEWAGVARNSRNRSLLERVVGIAPNDAETLVALAEVLTSGISDSYGDDPRYRIEALYFHALRQPDITDEQRERFKRMREAARKAMAEIDKANAEQFSSDLPPPPPIDPSN